MDKDYDKLCMGCMNGECEPGKPCPLCGFAVESYTPAPHILPLKTILNGKYLVGKVLGQGGFGIIYLGWDLNLDMKLAIKEYYPDGFVTRDCHTTTVISAYAGDSEEFFHSGLEKFIDEAKRLAKFYTLPGIVSVRDYFRENGTAYIVMEFIEGLTLKAYLDQHGGRLPAGETFQMMRPVMDSLAMVHQAGIIHRDISPDNIMIDKAGHFRLLDFGAAREFNKDGSQTILLKHGFAPYEQYKRHGKQGPWTDIYALCATIYWCITGQVPLEAPDRIPKDPLQPPSALGAELSGEQEAVLMKGLSVMAEGRWQNIQEFQAALDRATPIEPKKHLKKLEELFSKMRKGISDLPAKKLGILAGSCGALLVIVLAATLLPKTGEIPVQGDQAHLPPSSQAEPSAVIPPIEEWGRQDGEIENAQGAAPVRQPADPGQVIAFADWAMEYHIRQGLNKPDGEITAGDLAGIQRLHICDIHTSINDEPPEDAGGRTSKMGDGSPVPHLTSLEDLEYFINLRELSLANQDFTDVSPIAQLTELVSLDLEGNHVSNLSPLSNLANLETLNLEAMLDFGLTDISPLSGLDSLKELNLSGNRNLVDLSPLASLSNLETLGLEYVGQKALEGSGRYLDITSLSGLSNLRELILTGCEVNDLEPLSRMTTLETLYLNSCPVKELSPLSRLTGLKQLQLDLLEGQNLSSLAGLTQLTDLEITSRHTSAVDLTPLKGMVKMERLLADSCRIADLSPLSGMTRMMELDVSSNKISDLSPLIGMTRMEKLDVSSNPISDWSALAGMTGIKRLDVGTSTFSDLSVLRGMTQLESLIANRCDISDLSPLAGMNQLTFLNVEENKVSDLSPLSSLENLEKLYASSNPGITNWSPVAHVEMVRGRPE